MKKMKIIDRNIHISMMSYPYRGEELNDYISSINNNYNAYYENIKKYDQLTNRKDYSQYLYRPIIYNIIGRFDLVFISLINKFNFTQKLLYPLNKKGGKSLKIGNIRMISYSGITTCIDEKTFENEIENNIFKNPDDFISITSLKLNNGLIIGNGVFLISKVIELIKELINGHDKSVKHIIIHSFNWSEITLVLFTNENMSLLQEVISDLRNCTFKKIKDKNIIERSLYNEFYEDQLEIENSHLFVDTTTYYGFKYGLNKKEIDTKIQMEIQLKPGHYSRFIPLYHQIDRDKPKTFSIAGKHDLIIPVKGSDYLTIIEQIREDNISHESKSQRLSNHYRSLKSKLLFDISVESERCDDSFNIKSKFINDKFSDPDKELVYNITKLDIIEKHLKELTISRSLREKVLKMFFNYNNGIKDPVLYNLYIDFKGLLDSLFNVINNKHSGWRKDKEVNTNSINVDSFEYIIMKYIRAFDDSFHVRFFNTNSVEDISDVNLDITGGSIQRLITTIDNIAKLISKRSNIKNRDLPVVTLNSRATVANAISVNISNNKLLEPEHLFAVIFKELLNYAFSESEKNMGNSTYKTFEIVFNEFLTNIKKNQPELANGLKAISVEYFYNDIFRYKVSFLSNPDLYTYWYWHVNLQNTQLYDHTGFISYENFLNILFRYIMFLKLIGKNNSYIADIEIPIPELADYWDKGFSKIINIVNSFFKFLQTKENELIKKENRINTDGIMLHKYKDEIDNLKSIHHLSDLIETGFTAKDWINIPEMKQRFIDYFEAVFTENSSTKKDYNILDLLYSPKYSDINYYISLSAAYMEFLYKKNKKIRYLRRNWNTGKILNVFTKLDEGFTFIDPYGGVFINSTHNRKKYMKLTNSVLFLLNHFGDIIKKNLFQV